MRDRSTATTRPTAPRHSLAEDGYAMLIGGAFIAFGVLLLRQAGLVTGGMAGIALLLSYVIHYPPSAIFLVINIPFFLIAISPMGRSFAAKSLIASLVIMALGMVVPMGFKAGAIHQVFAALFGGTVIGFGILAIARHGAGVGGLGVVALMLQKARGWNAGRSLMVGDTLILLASAPLLDGPRFFYSVLSAVAINAVLIVNHRPGRYTGY